MNPKKIIILIFQLFCLYTAEAEEEIAAPAQKYNYFSLPGTYDKWDMRLLIGTGITRLPTDIVEEEINTSPIVFGDLQMGLPWGFSTNLYFATNYISNIGSIGIKFSPLNEAVSISAGAKGSMWFGHLDLESIKLKSYGMIIKPAVTAGVMLDDINFNFSFEMQWGRMYTFSDDSLLATFNQPKSGYTLRVDIEQPFYSEQLLLIGIGLNYNTFYYQSWLSYSAIKEYILYPEVYMGFTL